MFIARVQAIIPCPIMLLFIVFVQFVQFALGA